MNWYVRGR
ncbi:hypothetical protein CGLO_13013 [Colletotrichum gloeosporioides Cg-14]|uniref:Uncharacterized protein n=1 Tax=Colletotrichum gloeosporioides (strain Cg-14) TaxID=1237896 RepID=T0LI15_COLGC|nr:hypothetical protein CGLO_13013 [Colletotrichum gloeosporioides Cg-14]